MQGKLGDLTEAQLTVQFSSIEGPTEAMSALFTRQAIKQGEVDP